MLKNFISINSIHSTNDAINAYEIGTILIAKHQEKGRGRHGKFWLSPIGGLYFSYKILVPQICSRGFIPIAAGIACHRAFRELTGQELFLKWPNDILNSQEKKLAGILVESKKCAHKRSIGKGSVGKEICIIGIGINLQSTEDFGFLELDSKLSLNPSLIALHIANQIDQIFHPKTFDASSENLNYWQQHSIFQSGELMQVYTNQAHASQGENLRVGRVDRLDKNGVLYLADLKTKELIPLSSEQASNLRKVPTEDIA